MTVAVVTCVYGNYYDRFLPRWWETVRTLDPAPDQVVVASDRTHPYPFDQVVRQCPWLHPQAFYLDAAIRTADTDWVWVCDVDDFPRRDGLQGLEDVEADVWQLGFKRSDGETYVPEHTTAGAYLASDRNALVGSSMFRVDAYAAAGGYKDVAFQDWELWRSLFTVGASFAFSTRVHFDYMLHNGARSHVELTADRRRAHVDEMIGAEHAYA